MNAVMPPEMNPHNLEWPVLQITLNSRISELAAKQALSIIHSIGRVQFHLKNQMKPAACPDNQKACLVLCIITNEEMCWSERNTGALQKECALDHVGGKGQ